MTKALLLPKFKRKSCSNLLNRYFVYIWAMDKATELSCFQLTRSPHFKLLIEKLAREIVAKFLASNLSKKERKNLHHSSIATGNLSILSSPLGISLHVAKGSLLKKNPCLTNHNILHYPCLAYSFEATDNKLNPAFKQHIFYEHYRLVLEKVVLCLYAGASCVDPERLTRQPIIWHSPREMLLTMDVFFCFI